MSQGDRNRAILYEGLAVFEVRYSNFTIIFNFFSFVKSNKKYNGKTLMDSVVSCTYLFSGKAKVTLFSCFEQNSIVLFGKNCCEKLRVLKLIFLRIFPSLFSSGMTCKINLEYILAMSFVTSKDKTHLRCNLVEGSIVDGINEQTLY